VIWIGWAIAGVVATLVMDICGGIARKVGLTHGAPPELIGRFFMSVFRGHLTRLDPALSATSAPLPLVLLVHYAIGATLALSFGLATRGMAPPWWACVVYGVATTVLPAFWMFPALGFGVLGSRGPAEMLLFRTALLNHLFFGLGLALASTLIVARFE
jgi:hypothetical protein